MTTTPRIFHLQRDHDVSGVSGTGRVADGIQWSDGTVAIRWLGDRPSTVHWDRLDDAEHIHGHSGATRIVWDGEQPPAASIDRAALAGLLAHHADQLAATFRTYASTGLPEDKPGAERAADLLDLHKRQLLAGRWPDDVKHMLTVMLTALTDECPQCNDTGACNGGPCPLRRRAAEAQQAGAAS